MKQVHIIRWKATRAIEGVYSDFEKAKGIVKKRNNERAWYHKMLCDAKYVVQTFNVEG